MSLDREYLRGRVIWGSSMRRPYPSPRSRASFLIVFGSLSLVGLGSACSKAGTPPAPVQASPEPVTQVTQVPTGATSPAPTTTLAPIPTPIPTPVPVAPAPQAKDASVASVSIPSKPAVPVPPPAATGPDVLTSESLTVAGVARSYGLRLPRGYDPKVAYPLVFVFHGDGETGPSLYSYFKFQSASGESAVLVYPSGEGRTWDLYTSAEKNKDVAFFEAMLGKIGGRVSIDKTKVFLVGWSNGAFFANQLACRRSSLVRAVASNSGGAPYEPESPNDKWPNGFTHCPNEAPVAFLAVHGTLDGTVEPAGGEFSATYWASVNGCNATRSPAMAAQAGLPTPCESYPGCRAGKPTVYCPIPGMGHQLWQNAAKAEWDFFKSL